MFGGPKSNVDISDCVFVVQDVITTTRTKDTPHVKKKEHQLFPVPKFRPKFIGRNVVLFSGAPVVLWYLTKMGIPYQW